MDAEGWQKLKTQMLTRLIQERQALYTYTKNPIHAFEAYRASRAAKIPPPEWFLEMLDQWASVLSEERPTGSTAIAKALGLGGRGGGPSIISQALTQSRNLRLAQRIFSLQEPRRLNGEVLKGKTLSDAISTAAEEFHVSPERAEQIWYEIVNATTP